MQIFRMVKLTIMKNAYLFKHKSMFLLAKNL